VLFLTLPNDNSINYLINITATTVLTSANGLCCIKAKGRVDTFRYNKI